MLVPWIMRLRPSQELGGCHDYQDNSRQGFKFLMYWPRAFLLAPANIRDWNELIAHFRTAPLQGTKGIASWMVRKKAAAFEEPPKFNDLSAS
jgi:hypothetical protein